MFLFLSACTTSNAGRNQCYVPGWPAVSDLTNKQYEAIELETRKTIDVQQGTLVAYIKRLRKQLAKACNTEL